MRALGYYLTESEANDMKTEIRFAHYKYNNRSKDEITFDEFIKLYVNFRPVFELDIDLFQEAFNTLFDKKDNISRDELIAALNTFGEQISEKELLFIVDALIGENTEKKNENLLLKLLEEKKNKGNKDINEDLSLNINEENANILNKIPNDFKVENFVKDILGFNQE